MTTRPVPLRNEAVRVDKPWGHEQLWAHTDRYVGKILVIEAGRRLSLQLHERKDETILVLSGRLRLHHNAVDGTLTTTRSRAGRALPDPRRSTIEPDLALIKYKKLVGGGVIKIVNNTVPAALIKLGYSPAQVEKIVTHIDSHRHHRGRAGVEAGAPGGIRLQLPSAERKRAPSTTWAT